MSKKNITAVIWDEGTIHVHRGLNDEWEGRTYSPSADTEERLFDLLGGNDWQVRRDTIPYMVAGGEADEGLIITYTPPLAQ